MSAIGSLRSALVAGGTAALLAACVASTQLNAQWVNPNAGKSHSRQERHGHRNISRYDITPDL